MRHKKSISPFLAFLKRRLSQKKVLAAHTFAQKSLPNMFYCFSPEIFLHEYEKRPQSSESAINSSSVYVINFTTEICQFFLMYRDHDEILFFKEKVAWDGFLGIPSYRVCIFRVSNIETFLNIPFSLTDILSLLSISNWIQKKFPMTGRKKIHTVFTERFISF
jgi:hypothetical protein